MISRDWLERNQIGLYALTLVAAAAIGLLWPDFAAGFDGWITWVLAVLMFGMFSQIPFLRLREALTNRRFMYALLVVNFAAVPLLVWGLTRFLPDDSTLLLGVLLVLLTPCIDYVIVFTHLGRGDEKLMLVSTPILFVAQMLLLPVYLWLLMGSQAAELVSAGPFVEAFATLIAVPLALALLVQAWAARQQRDGERQTAGGGQSAANQSAANQAGANLPGANLPAASRLLDAAAWLPVPFMALTLFVVVASQIAKLYHSVDLIIQVIPIYIAYMAIAPIIARIAARLFRLDVGAGRALIFSSGTRNSLVVLPFALALPEPLNGLAAAVIVTQTMVELVGELVYIRLVPNVLLRDAARKR